MHIFFKTIKILVITILTLVVLLFAIAEFAEDKIAAISINQINKSIELPVSYGAISFSLLRDFPRATLKINDIWLGSPRNDSTGHHIDTLATINNLYVAVRLMPLVKQQNFDIVEIDVAEATTFYTVFADSTTNIDFLTDTTQVEVVDTSAATINIALRKLSVKNMHIHYQDYTQLASAHLHIPKISVNGSVTNNYYEGTIEGEALLTNCNFKQTNLCEMQKTVLDFDLNYANNIISINSALIDTDGADMSISGKVSLTDSITTDLIIDAPKLDIEELTKYAPPKLLSEYGIEETTGILQLNGTIIGCVSDSTLPNIAINFGLKNGTFSMKDHPPLKNLSFNGIYNNGALCNSQSTNLSINAFNFNTPQSQGRLDLSLQNLDSPQYSATLLFEGDLEELSNYYIPDSLLNPLTGQIDALISTNGQLPDPIDSTFIDYLAQNTKGSINLSNFNYRVDSTLSVDSCSFNLEYDPYNFYLSNGRFQIPAYNLNVRDAAIKTKLSGRISNYTKMGINVDSFFVATNNSTITANGQIASLSNPNYKLNSTIHLDMGEINKMLPDTIVQYMNGSIIANISSAGTLRPDSISEDMDELIFKNGIYNAQFTNLTVEMPDTLMQIKNLSGGIRINPDSISIFKSFGNFAGIKFSADSTHIKNYFNSIIKNKPEYLMVEGNFGLGNIDYAMLDAFMPSDTLEHNDQQINNNNESESDSTSESFNFKYKLKGSLTVNRLKYNKTIIDNISCLFNISDSSYIVDKLKFNAFNGFLNNSLRYDMAPNGRTLISFRSDIEKVDISQLLEEFDNFDQNEISHEQISGLFSTTMDGKFLMLNDTLVMDSTLLKGDLMLEDGGLFNYKRAEELAEFTNISELDNILFKTMESKLFIFNNAMYVPKTDIKSNALNISAHGMQTFGDDYQYHLRIYLGEVLRGKTKRIRKKQAAMEDNPEDKRSGLTTLFIQASSIDGKSKNGLDNRSDRIRMQTKINVQEKMLDIIFHPLLVDFKTGVESTPEKTLASE